MSKRRLNTGKKKKRKGKVILTPEEVILARRRRLADREEIFSFVSRFIMMGIVLLFLFGFVFGITPMKNDDMKPRISAGDLMLYYRLENKWHTQDVIVLKKDGRQYTGRIVAKEGDTVEVTQESRLIVNGSVVIENDIYYATPKYEEYVTYPLTLEKNQFFVLCDYRNGAKDSRYYGPVNLKEVKGKVITVIRRSGL